MGDIEISKRAFKATLKNKEDHVPKSDAGDRYVILPENARNTLQRIMEIREQGEYLFWQNGKRIRSNGFRRKMIIIS